MVFFFAGRDITLGAILLLVCAVITAGPAGALTPAQPKAILVDGFRSAKFGMSETEVSKAVAVDFSLPTAAITRSANAIEGTSSIKVIVKNLLPNSGQAVVTYSFGFKSDTLDEVDVTWEAKAPGNSPAVLLQNGAILQNYLLTERFPPGTVTGSTLLTNGTLLLFRGTDSAGHVVALFISGPSTHDAAGNKTNITPSDLTIAYAANPAHPDGFKITTGAF